MVNVSTPTGDVTEAQSSIVSVSSRGVPLRHVQTDGGDLDGSRNSIIALRCLVSSGPRCSASQAMIDLQSFFAPHDTAVGGFNHYLAPNHYAGSMYLRT